MPLPKDPIKAEETRRKMSEAAKKRMANPEIHKKIRDANIGKKQSPETIAKRVEKLKGQQRSPRSKKNCAYCGKELILAEWERNRIFCSMECKGKWQSENAVGEKGAHWKGGEITKKCEECGKEFSFEKNRMEKARFCSQHCKGVWLAKNGFLPKLPVMTGFNHPQWKGGDVIKKCEECGKEYCVRRAREDSTKFCSPKCRGIWMSRNLIGEQHPNWSQVVIICKECGKIFSVKFSHKERSRFCSRLCQGTWVSKNLSGQNNPNWTGGPKDYCEKWSLEFRRRIRAFFNYECAECGTPQNEKLLHCHHVYYDKKACCNVNENGKYVSNLGITNNPHSFEIIGDPNKFITLCDSCHAKSSGKKNREHWARHFEEIINNYYLGKSYFTKEEFEKIR
jgi:endogenous inhibitor of DNA gyrase (YacG/DUF329 family)